MGNDDGPPPAQSARVKPRRPAQFNSGASKKRAVGDPRFDSLFGKADAKHFEQHYKFLREQQEEEESKRKFRIRCLKCVLRRCALEESNEPLEEYDLSDTEREVFGEDHRSELLLLKRTPPAAISAELAALQRTSQVYVSQVKDAAVNQRKQKVKNSLMKRETDAVKEGTKQKAFFPKRKDVKRAVLNDTFDRLKETGGKAAVDKYLIGKSKRRS